MSGKETLEQLGAGWEGLEDPRCGNAALHDFHELLMIALCCVLCGGHSPANASRALRTLRRMMGKAADWGVIVAALRIKLMKEEGRSATIDSEAETKLLEVAKQPLRDVLIIMLDSGMRPGEVFRICWKDIDWNRGTIFIPRGKTPRSRGYVPMSDRVMEALHLRRTGPERGWMFPSDSRPGHLTIVVTAFETAHAEAKLSSEIKLDSVRHTLATKIMGATDDLSLVMRALGHTNAQTAMIYQHLSLGWVRDVVNENPLAPDQESGPFPVRHNHVTCAKTEALPQAASC